MRAWSVTSRLLVLVVTALLLLALSKVTADITQWAHGPLLKLSGIISFLTGLYLFFPRM